MNFLNQIFLSFFFKKPKKKTTAPTTGNLIVDEDIAAVEEAEYDAQVEQDDEGQIAHDESTVLSIHDQVMEVMRTQDDQIKGKKWLSISFQISTNKELG